MFKVIKLESIRLLAVQGDATYKEVASTHLYLMVTIMSPGSNLLLNSNELLV